MTPEPTETDLLVIGGGAAGLATAIFAARADPSLRVRCVDGARRLGAKILVSGGSRCNVTNRHVGADDFWGGSSRTVSRVLRAFPEGRTVEFFSGLGVALHEEEHGKLFPDTHRARTVLDALIREAEQRGVVIQCERRVTEVRLLSVGFLVVTPCERFVATHLVLATGGLSLPKSGSDGGGYALAAHLGHGHVQTTPALVPLLLDGAAHHELSGISHDVALTCRTGGSRVRIVGSLLWTHWGASGPAVLDVSRHWHRARLEADDATVSLSLCPSYTHDTLDAFLLEQRAVRPRALVRTVMAGLMPAAVADAWSARAGVAAHTSMSHLTREARRALVHALLETPLAVTGSRGYNHAEVTAGGVPLDEIDPASMASRVCPGLYLVGEILDVDGRLGGFNFQWAWSSAWVAGQAIGGRRQKTEGRSRRQKARASTYDR